MKKVFQTDNSIGHIEMDDDHQEDNVSPSGGVMLYPGHDETKSFPKVQQNSSSEGSGGILLLPENAINNLLNINK